MTELRTKESNWPVPQLILFRFITTYFLLSTAIWGWLGSIPFLSFLSSVSSTFTVTYTELFNDYVFQIKPELVPTRGSGDTSMGWATLYAQLFISLMVCILWSILDRKRANYRWGSLVVRNVVRYYIILFAFIYGIIKLYGLQMPSPSNSYYATDLGHFSAMRFSWNFIGYSKGYEFFSGLMEVFVGVFLLYRRTILLGALLGIGVFANVFLLNMSYDIPVKIFSFQLLFACAFISFNNLGRLVRFFALNRSVEPDTSWDIPNFRPWVRPTRIALKSLFVIVFVLSPFYTYYNAYASRASGQAAPPFESGFYAVGDFIVNGDTIVPEIGSSLHWQDLAIDPRARGSIGLRDEAFRVRYGRSYFSYDLDTISNILSIKKSGGDQSALFRGTYETLGDRSLRLRGLYKSVDTLQVDLIWDPRDYQLARKEFNWLLESVP